MVYQFVLNKKNKGDVINIQTIIENKELVFDAKIMWKKPEN